MNTENINTNNSEVIRNQDKNISIGTSLRNAREQMGLSQQAVAEKLCLKVSTIRDIEEDKSANLALTFLHGYIRSYAKLVHLSDNELILTMKDRQTSSKTTRITSVQNFSSNKYRKKRDCWTVSFTWIILIMVITMIGKWWWQNYKNHQKDINIINNQSSASLRQSDSNKI